MCTHRPHSDSTGVKNQLKAVTSGRQQPTNEHLLVQHVLPLNGVRPVLLPPVRTGKLKSHTRMIGELSQAERTHAYSSGSGTGERLTLSLRFAIISLFHEKRSVCAGPPQHIQ